MIVEVKKQDLFDLENPIIGHGANCLGIMGAGIAAAFKTKYPMNYLAYKSLCNEKKCYVPGSVFVSHEADGRIIANLATQFYPGPNARLEWLEASLRSFEKLGFEFITLPWIGCGIGGLDKKDVTEVLEKSNLLIKICEI